MPDDLDNLIRAAMKTLDDEVPPGYFDALPTQTLARLEGNDVQQVSLGPTPQKRDSVTGPPPAAAAAVAKAAAVKAAPAAAAKAAPAVAAQEAYVDAEDTAPVAKVDDEDREDSGLHDIRNL